MESTRVCRQCNIEGPTDTFASAGIKNGKKYYRYLCKSCYHRSKQPRKDDLKQFVLNIKKDSGCSICGFSDYRALQFHHIIAETKHRAVSDMVAHGFSKEKILEEIAKCIIICANCHQIKHFKE